MSDTSKESRTASREEELTALAAAIFLALNGNRPTIPGWLKAALIAGALFVIWELWQLHNTIETLRVYWDTLSRDVDALTNGG